MQRFVRDDEAVVRSVLVDLIESGLVQRDGQDDGAPLAALELDPAVQAPTPAALDAMVLVALHRLGPLEPQELAVHVPIPASELSAALTRLADAGLVNLQQRGGVKVYGCEGFAIGFGDESGWEAAVFDHYQALVAALVNKLRAGPRRADLADKIGGSTFTFDVWDGHPMREEALGYLKRMREQGMALRRAIDQHNAGAPIPEGAAALQVIAYVGQNVVRAEEESDGE